MISQGEVNKNLMVEVYPLCLKIIDSRDKSQTVIWLSKKVQQSSFCYYICKFIFIMILKDISKCLNCLVALFGFKFLSFKCLLFLYFSADVSRSIRFTKLVCSDVSLLSYSSFGVWFLGNRVHPTQEAYEG